MSKNLSRFQFIYLWDKTVRDFKELIALREKRAIENILPCNAVAFVPKDRKRRNKQSQAEMQYEATLKHLRSNLLDDANAIVPTEKEIVRIRAVLESRKSET